jgi:hypothetical protein
VGGKALNPLVSTTNAVVSGRVHRDQQELVFGWSGQAPNNNIPGADVVCLSVPVHRQPQAFNRHCARRFSLVAIGAKVRLMIIVSSVVNSSVRWSLWKMRSGLSLARQNCPRFWSRGKLAWGRADLARYWQSIVMMLETVDLEWLD